MEGKPTTGRRRLQMLHDLRKGVALKRAAEERKGRRYRGMMSETSCTAED